METGTGKSPEKPRGMVLDYQRAQRARRVAIGGLRLMGILLMIVTVLLVALGVLGTRRMGRWNVQLIAQFIVLGLPFLWGACYVLWAMLIQRGIRWAGWAALAMTGVKTLAFGVLWAVVLASQTWDSPWRPWYVQLIEDVCLGAALVGFAAVVVEVWRAVRDPRVWVR